MLSGGIGHRDGDGGGRRVDAWLSRERGSRGCRRWYCRRVEGRMHDARSEARNEVTVLAGLLEQNGGRRTVPGRKRRSRLPAYPELVPPLTAVCHLEHRGAGT